MEKNFLGPFVNRPFELLPISEHLISSDEWLDAVRNHNEASNRYRLQQQALISWYFETLRTLERMEEPKQDGICDLLLEKSERIMSLLQAGEDRLFNEKETPGFGVVPVENRNRVFVSFWLNVGLKEQFDFVAKYHGLSVAKAFRQAIKNEVRFNDCWKDMDRWSE